MEPAAPEEHRDAVPLPRWSEGRAEIRHGRDYLDWDSLAASSIVIITNSAVLTEGIFRKSLSEAEPDGTPIYLVQRVNFLGSKKRVPFWAGIGFPNKHPDPGIATSTVP